jgi:hypothetical protein
VSICFYGGGEVRLLGLDSNDVGKTSGVLLSFTFMKKIILWFFFGSS